MFVAPYMFGPGLPDQQILTDHVFQAGKKSSPWKASPYTSAAHTKTITNPTSDRKIEQTQPNPYQIISPPKSSSIFKSLRTSCF